MKILIVTNLYPPAILGGYEILCESTVGRMVERGHELCVLASDYRLGGNRESLGRHGETVVRSLRLIRSFDSPMRSERAAHLRTYSHNRRTTVAQIRQFKPDLVFFWSQRRLSLGPLRAASASGLPFAVTFNDDFLAYYRLHQPGFKARRLAGFMLDYTLLRFLTLSKLPMPAMTTISESLREQMLREGTPVSNAKVIYQGIEIERFPLKENPGSLHDPIRLLYVGQVHEYKGVHTAIEAAALLVDQGRNLTLDIIGDGDPDYMFRLRQLAENHYLRNRVRLLGRRSHDELPELYRAGDILLFTSIWEEPFGLTHLEAMASGTPVISTTVGGPGEFLEDGENALTFDAGDSTQLADKIVLLIDDEKARVAIANGGRKCVSDRFTMDRYVDELERWLAKIVDEWPNP